MALGKPRRERQSEAFVTDKGYDRLNKEIERRTHVVTIFPNEASLLRLASVVLSEISDDYEPNVRT